MEVVKWTQDGKYFEWLGHRELETTIKLIKPYTMGGIAVTVTNFTDDEKMSQSFRNVEEAKKHSENFMNWLLIETEFQKLLDLIPVEEDNDCIGAGGNFIDWG